MAGTKLFLRLRQVSFELGTACGDNSSDVTSETIAVVGSSSSFKL